jgi:hypothetical protein
MGRTPRDLLYPYPNVRVTPLKFREQGSNSLAFPAHRPEFDDCGRI